MAANNLLWPAYRARAAALQLQEHVFEASGIFLAEYLRIDRGLSVHRLVVSLEDRTFADSVVSRELDGLILVVLVIWSVLLGLT